MELFKKKFIYVIILAILAGGVAGFYIVQMQRSQSPAPMVASGSGTNPEKIGEVM